MTNDSNKQSQLSRVLYWVLIILLVLAPFQGLITTWPASIFGHQIVWQVWKEALLVLSMLIIGFLAITNAKLRRCLTRDYLFLATGAYVAYSILITLFVSNDYDSALAGLLLNLRIIGIFVLGWIVGSVHEVSKDHVVKKYILPVALVVAGFAVLQLILLPPEFLSHFGYYGKPIPARFTIDGDMNAIRVASTTRGPNPLGAYLIVPIVLTLGFLYDAVSHRIGRKLSKKDQLIKYGVLFAILTLALYGTHSRSAIIGCFLACASWLFLCFRKRNRLYVLAGVATLLLIFGATTYVFRSTNFVKSTIFHDNAGNTSSVTSNVGHIKSLEEGLQSVSNRPLTGCGVGCAGPASFRSPKPSIAENYYIQIAQETGVAGLILFLVILILIGKRLYRYQAQDETARALLAALIGISIVNLLLHGWADDTIAYIWWGLAGLTIGSYSRLGSGTATATHLHTSELKSELLSN